MEFVVIVCGGCGAAVRIRQTKVMRAPLCPQCGTELCPSSEPRADHRRAAGSFLLAMAGTLALALWAVLSGPAALPQGNSSVPTISSAASPSISCPVAAKHRQDESNRDHSRILTPPSPVVVKSSSESSSSPTPIRQVSARRETTSPSLEPLAAPAAPQIEEPAAGTFKVRDDRGQPVVARLHGRSGDKTVLILPDGQLGIPNMLIPAQEPFRPYTADELLPRLQQGPLGEFQVFRTAHYLIFYKSSHRFAEESGLLLEDLYRRLLDAFRKNKVPVHEAEFPLVAVIYRTEREFRANHPVESVVQAFYEIYTNRITFYEQSDQDDTAPEISALRKPQTVAHEGTHQILQNIGVHPRLSSWPIWLVEGLAEYCATPAFARKGGKPIWDGLGMINGLHMATIRELNDPLSLKIAGDNSPVKSLVREPGKPLVECLVRKTVLTPTEYSLAWAMTHYLAFKRQDDFVAFLKKMSERPPLEPRTPEDHLTDFENAFGRDMVKLDRAIDLYLRKLDTRKFDRMPFYAVMYEQVIPTGLVRRGRVTQSPQVIWQWVQEVTVPQGAHPTWQAIPHDTPGRAKQAVEEWMKGSG